jgi:hypothetical protein
MSFLDDLVSEGPANPEIDHGVLAKIENLIWYSSLDDKQKAKETKRMLRLETMEDAYKMVNFLQGFQPVPGQDRVAITQYEIVEATRRRVERENFKERSK